MSDLRRRQQQQAADAQQQQPGAAAALQLATATADGLKTWHLWMLFGLGWPSVLLFFMSLIPTFTAKAQGHLLTFGWLFVACWWACAAAGFVTDTKSSKQSVAYTANTIMAGVGTLLGGVLTASYAYYNWPWRYIIGAAVVVGGTAFAVQQLNEGGSGSGGSRGADQGAGAGAGAGDAAAAPPAAPAPAAAGAAAVGDLIDLNEG